MKHLFLLALIVTGQVFAAGRVFGSPTESGVGGEHRRMYIGFASDSAVTGNALPAASVMLGMGENLNLQTYFLVPTIDPFLFAIGGNIKTTVFGNQASGLHLGGGLAFNLINAAAPLSAADDTRDFVLRFNGILGAHFLIVNRVMIIVDGGVTMALNIDKSDADLTLGSNSALLGLSVLYEI